MQQQDNAVFNEITEKKQQSLRFFQTGFRQKLQIRDISETALDSPPEL